MKKLTVFDLQKIALAVRRDVVKMIAAAGSGHPAGSLSSVELFVAFYFSILNHDPKNPNWEERDRLFVSHGHTCPAFYAVLAKAGYFPHQRLTSYSRFGSPLQGHPEKTKLAGVEISSGSLGMGLGQAIGYALAGKLDNQRFRVFCLTSDGEHDEGSHWEAVLLAAKYKLANLTLIVDRNKIQIDGTTEEVLPLESLADKYRAFGWNTLEINGHSFKEILAAVETARSHYQGPTVIIAETVAGKGVSFMEANPDWHARALNKQELKIALEELA